MTLFVHILTSSLSFSSPLTEVPQVWRDLIELCWHQDPDKRPTCTGVLVRLAALQTEFERNPDYFSLSVPSHAKANTEGASTPAPANTS